MRSLLVVGCVGLAAACAQPADPALPPAGELDDPASVISSPAPALPEVPVGVAPAPPKPLVGRAVATLFPAGAHDLRSVRTAVIGVDLENALGPIELVLELKAPGGQIFERRTRSMRGAGEALHADFELPVAGTLVQSARLAGTWTAHFLVGGAPLASTTFELLP